MSYSNHKRSYIYKNNKRHLRADGLSLLLSALRPRLLAPVVAVAALAVSSGWLFPTSVSAVSLTLAIPEAITLDIMPNAEGAFKKSESKQISIKTDAFAGYTLSIKAKSGSDLVNGENKISSISAETTEEEFNASGMNNTWGFLPSKFNSAENTKFRPAPTTENSVIDKTNTKNDEKNNYDLTIAAKVDSTLPTGEYNNTFVISAAANTVSYSIQYELNDGTGGPEQNPQTGNTAEQMVKLSDKEPTKEDYKFLGWCDVPTTDEKCSGNQKQPGDEITLTNGENNLKFYAMWEPTVLYMQNWNGCNDLGMEETITLTDKRDNNTYTVAKLKDGKCWMTQNLRIGNNNETVTLYADTTDMIRESYVLPRGSTSGFDGAQAEYLYINQNNHGYGGYYTWKIATAGDTHANSHYRASTSICPKNWTLPNKDEASILLQKYNNNNSGEMLAAPLSFVLPGVWCGSRLTNEGNYAYYHTLDTEPGHTDGQPYEIHLGARGGNVSYSGWYGYESSYDGYSIRCLKR